MDMPVDRIRRAREFTQGILRLARSYRRRIDLEFAAIGVAEARAIPILLIDRLGDGVRQGVLAEAIGVKGPSLVRQLDRLCLERLVERRDDPQDRRGKTLHLTKAGRDLVASIDLVGDRLRRVLLEDVSDADLATALRVFDAVAKALEAERACPRDPTPGADLRSVAEE